MTQNIVSLNFTDADLTAIEEALAVLEQRLAPLIGLTPDPRPQTSLPRSYASCP